MAKSFSDLLSSFRRPAPESGAERPPARPEPQCWHEKDQVFLDSYDTSLRETGSGDQRQAFPVRLYNTLQFFQQTGARDGWIAECGCFRGLSAHMICSYQKRFDPAFDGRQFQIFDSFEGLSVPTKQDMLETNGEWKVGTPACKPGHYGASLEHVRHSLRNFPQIEFHPGWIPQSLQPELGKEYKFVHLDLDIYEPTKGALEFFYPRLLPGGIMVLDDYGFIRWPGVRKATEEFCQPRNLQPIILTTGNAILIKPS